MQLGDIKAKLRTDRKTAPETDKRRLLAENAERRFHKIRSDTHGVSGTADPEVAHSANAYARLVAEDPSMSDRFRRARHDLTDHA